MKEYIIAIKETVVDSFTVHANSPAEALEIANEKYRSGEFVLAPGEVTFKQMSVMRPSSASTEWLEF